MSYLQENKTKILIKKHSSVIPFVVSKADEVGCS